MTPVVAVIAASLTTACGDKPAPLNDASELARETLIVDTHIDVPYRLTEQYEDVTEATVKGDFDYPRARAGGLDVAGDSLPEGLKDVSDYPGLVAGLLARGYSLPDIGKICGANIMRVWRDVELRATGD